MTDWSKYTVTNELLAPAVLAEATAQIGEIARAEGTKIALAGGFALQHYGSPRLTGDVDVLVDKPIEALPEGKALSFGGERTRAPNGVPVDVILRDDDLADLYDAALHASVKHPETPVRIVAPEYLAAMKMAAGRGKDEEDLEFLIVSDAIDLVETRKVIKEFLGVYAVREFNEFVEVTKWKASRDKL